MLKNIKLACGNVAKNTLLTHAHVHDGRIQTSTGVVALDIAVEELGDINCTVPADKLLRAVNACGESAKFKVGKAKLSVAANKFKAMLPLADHNGYPVTKLEGKAAKIDQDILSVFKLLRAFIDGNSHHPWANGIWLDGEHAYATDNIAMVRIPLVIPNGPINIPLVAVDTLLKINECPSKITIKNNCVYFHWADKWMRSALIDASWPDVSAMITGTNIIVPEGLSDTVKELAPFGDVLLFSESGVTTSDNNTSASISLLGLTDSAFNAAQLANVLDIATHIDLGEYPKPCQWSGDNVVGILSGVSV